MTLFSAAELADLRAEQEAAMPSTCVVSNPTAETITAEGGTTPGTPTETTVACRIGVPSAQDQKVADRLAVVVDAALTLPWGTTVASDAQITCQETGKVYSAVYVNDEQTYQTAVRVLCRSLRNA